MIHAGLGEITENDIMLASASDAIVVGFNVRANPKAIALAEQEQVDVRYYDIIYNLLQDIHAALEGLLEPIVEEKVVGRAEVRQVFSITKVGTIAGCMVLDGKIERNSLARVVRKGKVVSEGGKINSLKRFKDDVKEVQAGYECGIGIDRFNDFKAGDIIEAYTQEKVKAILEPRRPGRKTPPKPPNEARRTLLAPGEPRRAPDDCRRSHDYPDYPGERLPEGQAQGDQKPHRKGAAQV